MAIQQADPEALQLYQIIGAQLLAVIQAEVQAAQVSADFIKRIGFETRKAPSPGGEAGAAAGPQPPAPEAGGTPEAAAAPGTSQPASEAANPPASREKSLQDGDDIGDLKMAEFSIDHIGADGQKHPYTIRVPVLSLFPIPLLQVKQAEFEYNLRILSRVPLQTPDKDHAETGHVPSTDYLSPDRIELKGMLGPSSTAGEQSSAMVIKVKVSMGQADIPAGLTKLLGIADQVTGASPRKRQVSDGS
jgi:hypothetical protein